MIKPITKDLVDKWDDAVCTASQLEQEIINRVNYVISVWVSAFGGKLTNWWFSSADEGEMGHLADHMSKDSIYSIHIECKPQPKPNDEYSMVIIDKDGSEYGWESEIPLRWLFEDCEDEIVKGKALYDQKLIKKKEAAALRRTLKKKLDTALAEQAKAKLTPEELQALKKVL